MVYSSDILLGLQFHQFGRRVQLKYENCFAIVTTARIFQTTTQKAIAYSLWTNWQQRGWKVAFQYRLAPGTDKSTSHKMWRTGHSVSFYLTPSTSFLLLQDIRLIQIILCICSIRNPCFSKGYGVTHRRQLTTGRKWCNQTDHLSIMGKLLNDVEVELAYTRTTRRKQWHIDPAYVVWLYNQLILSPLLL